MDAKQVIDSYVTDVALLLPRKQRNDVALELRELLSEGLRDKAAAAGRAADAAMATEFANAFGQPEDVAARYRPTLMIIDPADGHAFLRATLIGLVLIWGAGLLTYFSSQPFGSTEQFLGALGQWWARTLVDSLWWPGALVFGFATGSWIRRSSPRVAAWTPRASDRIQGGRAALAFALLGVLTGCLVLFDPAWLLFDVIFGGRAAPAAYAALTYTDAFRHGLAPWLFALILLNAPLFTVVLVQGRWSTPMRRLCDGLGLATCAMMAWVVLDGPVLVAPISDRFAKGAMVLIIVFSLFALGYQRYRRVEPAPS